MRLSWYADTGVAVFSIWQGGMCTGTFRLPIGDLPRMIEVLQRGPDEPRPRSRSREHSWGGREPAGTGQREVSAARLPYPGGGGRYTDEPRTGYSQADAEETSAVGYGLDDPPRPRRDRQRGTEGLRSAGAGRRAPRAGYELEDTAGPRSLGHDRGEYPAPGSGQYSRDERYGQGEQYSRDEPYSRDESHGQGELYGRDEQYGQGAQYGQGEQYGQAEGDDPYGGYRPLSPREPDSGGVGRDDDGYGQERFVPPYVRGAVGDYSGDIPPRTADPMRPAYRGGPDSEPGGEPDYLHESWPPPGYSDGRDYRLAESPPEHSAGRHGKYRPAARPADGYPDLDPVPDYDSGPGDYLA